MKAFDLSRFQRIIAVEGRIHGKFAVLGGTRVGAVWITPIDVTIEDESRTSGLVFYSDDFSASVRDGVAEVSKRGMRPNHLAELESVEPMLLDLLVMVAQAYNGGPGSVIESGGSES